MQEVFGAQNSSSKQQCNMLSSTPRNKQLRVEKVPPPCSPRSYIVRTQTPNLSPTSTNEFVDSLKRTQINLEQTIHSALYSPPKENTNEFFETKPLHDTLAATSNHQHFDTDLQTILRHVERSKIKTPTPPNATPRKQEVLTPREKVNLRVHDLQSDVYKLDEFNAKCRGYNYEKLQQIRMLQRQSKQRVAQQIHLFHQGYYSKGNNVKRLQSQNAKFNQQNQQVSQNRSKMQQQLKTIRRQKWQQREHLIQEAEQTRHLLLFGKQQIQDWHTLIALSLSVQHLGNAIEAHRQQNQNL